MCNNHKFQTCASLQWCGGAQRTEESEELFVLGASGVHVKNVEKRPIRIMKHEKKKHLLLTSKAERAKMGSQQNGKTPANYGEKQRAEKRL